MQRRAVIRAIAASVLAPLASCAPVRPDAPKERRWKSAQLTGHPLAGWIWDVTAGRRVGREDLFRVVRRARYRLIGEVHDNPDHHDLQLELLEALGESGLGPAVAFEQLDREHDPALQAAFAASGLTAETVAEAARFDRRSWRWEFYRPLVESALRHGMAVRAANLSRADAARVVKSGLDSLGPGRAAALRIDAVWSGAREDVLRHLIVEGHCRALPDAVVPRMMAAQRARDATLAAALLDPGPDGAVLFAGNGHVRRDIAAPLYLQAARPGETIVSLGLLEVDAAKPEPGDYTGPGAGGRRPYDFVLFTARARRDDPCRVFSRKPAKPASEK